MIPELDARGYLPAGIDPATMKEIELRFERRNKTRRDQMESLRWLLGLARKAGVRRAVINGSFVTKKARRPEDVDCALMVDAEGRFRSARRLDFF